MFDVETIRRDAHEGARAKVAAFLNAASPQEIMFVRGTTKGINLLAAIASIWLVGGLMAIYLNSTAKKHCMS